MRNGNGLLKYLVRGQKQSEMLHSSGYARAQSGDEIGAAASAESFAKRRAIEERRKFVQGFRNARIAQSRNINLRAKPLVARETLGRAEQVNTLDGSARGAGDFGNRVAQARNTTTNPPMNSRGGIIGGRERR